MELQCKFIEGTNEQYSIRNDGFIIKHYQITKYKTKVIKDTTLAVKLADNTSQITIQGVNKRVYITKLLKQYFNIYPKVEYAPRKTDKNKVYTKTYRDKQIASISPYYIKSLNRTMKHIPEELVTITQVLIHAKRHLKLIQNGRT